MPSWASAALSDIADGNVIDWHPQAGPQCEAFYSAADELLYGGSAGGGKSALVVGLARIKHLASVIFRRTYPQLEDSIIKQTLKFYGDRREYNASKHSWAFADGCNIALRSMQYDDNKYDHQGAEYDLICFDELTQFLESQYIYLISRNRSSVPGQRCRIVNTSNPGGEGQAWVRKRWAAWLDPHHKNPAQPGELRWYARIKGEDVAVDGPEPIEVDGELIYPRSRTFIPASLKDNEYLGQDYLATLQALPEPLRSQLLNGDWEAGCEDDAYQVIPTAWIEAAMARWSETPPEPRMTAMGVDVARGGDDQTVKAKRYGLWVAQLEKYPGRITRNGQEVAALVAESLTDGGVAFIDVIGCGGSPFDIATENKLPIFPVNFANKSSMTDSTGLLRFVNLRAEYYWRVRELLDPKNGILIALPPDDELEEDLKAPRWSMQTNGIKIEAKEDIKKRLGRSTDCGDAVVLAFGEIHDGGLVRTDGPV